MKLTQEQKTFVENLLSSMTLEEKIGQMNQESPSIVGGFDVPFSELIEMLTDGRLPQEEFEKIVREYPWQISAERETAEQFRQEYIDGHVVLKEGWNISLE